MNRNQTPSVHDVIAVPIEAAEDVRILPGASELTHKNTAILPSLEPFLHLLPDLVGVNMDLQRHLYAHLYAAGVNAAFSLQKFICDSNSSGIPMAGIDQESADWKAV